MVGRDYSSLKEKAMGEDLHNQKETSSSSTTGWTDDEKRRLATVAYALMATQKYTQGQDKKVVMRGWEMKLAGKFTIDQIIYALDKYTDRNDDFPSPADIIKILNPATPRITESQYIQACKAIEAAGYYDNYGHNEQIKKDYENQNAEDFEHHEINKRRIQEVAERDRLRHMGTTRRIRADMARHIDEIENGDKIS